MKKFRRNLFSGFFLFAFLLVIEILAVLFLQFFLDNVLEISLPKDSNIQLIVNLVLLGVRLIGYIFAIVIFFRINNKMEAPEFKIPWVVGVLIFPIFFTFIYLIFGNHGLRKRDKIIISATRNAYNAHFLLTQKEQQRFDKELGDAKGVFEYIHRTTQLGVQKNNHVTYYKTGEEFFPELINCLEEAKEFIFMEFFIITDGKWWDAVQTILKRKAQEGVDVRIVYDDMGCSGTISARTPKKLGAFGIKCYKFHPLRPILSGLYNNRDHRKIVVIDHKYGFTGGMNLADEYANIGSKYGYWKDTMVKIEGSAINNLITTFLQNYNLCSGEVSDYNKFLNFDYPKYKEEGFIMPFGDGPGGIDDALIGEQNYINIINAAKKYCYISTPYLVPTYQLLDSLRNAALRGVDVRLIVPGIPDKKAVYAVAKSNFRFLLDAGVKIYTYTPGFNHMKTMLADDELAFVGTINFDFRSLVHHFECGATLYKNPCLVDIKQDFEQMMEVSHQVPANFKPSFGTRSFCTLIRLLYPLL